MVVSDRFELIKKYYKTLTDKLEQAIEMHEIRKEMPTRKEQKEFSDQFSSVCDICGHAFWRHDYDNACPNLVTDKTNPWLTTIFVAEKRKGK